MIRGFLIPTFCWVLTVAWVSTATAQVRLVTNSESSAEIVANSYRVTLRLNPDPQMTVWALLQEGKEEEIGSFPLDGIAQLKDHADADTNEPQFLNSSEEFNDKAVALRVQYGSLGQEQHQVLLRFYPLFFSYTLSIVKSRPEEIAELFYLAGKRKNGEIKYGRGRFEQIRTWTPDLYNVLIPEKGISRISLPPRGEDDDPGYIRGQQAGSPLISPYVVAVRSGSAWWAVGTIGIPNTYNGLGVVIGRSLFAVRYQTGSQALAQERGINGPSLGFYFGANADQVLNNYRASLPAAKTLAISGAASPAWWSRPIYCTWGDQTYTARMREGRLDESNGPHYATEKDIDRWLAIAEREKF